jgi:superoxide dismutase, Fe-Mn family
MPFTLVDLPFAKDALGTFMSAETLEFHHGKHHKAYVDKTNAVLDEKGLAGASLTDVIRAGKSKGDTPLFNNAAQIWNHNFFWRCLAPADERRPTGKLAALVEEGFGSTEALLEKLKAEAVGHFSNGWAWLVLDRGQLKITSLHDADTPVVHDGMQPLLTLDVWEHAYYIDYRNDRAKFAESVLANIIDWEFVGSNLDGDGIARADQQSEARTPEMAG